MRTTGQQACLPGITSDKPPAIASIPLDEILAAILNDND